MVDEITARSLSLGQEAEVHGRRLEADETYAIYDAYMVFDQGNQKWILKLDKAVSVKIPSDEEIDLTQVKELCAGIGGIAQGLEFLGMRRVASLELKSLMCQTMQKNSMCNIIQGGITHPLDRASLHLTPTPLRCLLASGFPCQPLSSQGDQLGHLDDRAQVFGDVIKSAWEQQCGGLLLENVPKAMKDAYIQDKVQKLAWSLGMVFQQTILRLEQTWPCRRTRWWLLMIPKKYRLDAIPDLTLDPPMQRLDSLFKCWPQWTEDEEEQLRLSPMELGKFQDPQYGKDIRVLQDHLPCPCFLHSYATGLEECPCGCRNKGFNEQRLLRDGLRGFYVLSQKDYQPRWVHPREAATLCGIDPMMSFPKNLKAGFCQIGQCASSIQAAWMGSHVLKATMKHHDPDVSLTAIKMYLIRQMHGFLPSAPAYSLHIHDPEENTDIKIKMSGDVTAKDLRQAELRLQGEGNRIWIGDTMGPMHEDYRLTSGPIHGPVVMATSAKRQKLIRLFKIICVEVQHLEYLTDEWDTKMVFCPTGTFLFEIYNRLKLDHQRQQCHDLETYLIRPDDRFWEDTTIIVSSTSQLNARGLSLLAGLGDRQLDRQAKRMIIEQGGETRLRWIPSVIMTQLFHNDYDEIDIQWLTEVAHINVASCAAHEDHWILLILSVKDQTLKVQCWDGMDHTSREEVLDFAERVKGHLNRQSRIRTKMIAFQHMISQTAPNTCGTVALIHLGCVLGTWNEQTCPNECEWRQQLLADPLPSSLFAKGWNDNETALKNGICEILHEHGVAEEHSEDRFYAALKKIGHGKLTAAIETKNPWAALKAAGSQPRVNFLWIRPDELDRQIKKRAETKCKVSTSNKKQGPGSKPKLAMVNMNPRDLQLIPGTFVTEDEREVQQISMDDVAADRTGLAFCTLEEVAPYMRNDKSLTLDALAVLTTAPIPPAEQGPLPVVNLRFPAKYTPTQEAVLIEGSLIQLGDCTILRAPPKKEIKISPLETKTYKVTVWRDEWDQDWQEFGANPVKNIVQVCPRLTRCRGERCGPECKRFRPPVDVEVDSVIVDVWGRGFFTSRGKRVLAAEADQFQVLLRIPCVCAEGIQTRSGQDGIYFEPRQPDGKAPHELMEVVWLPGSTKQEVAHQLKVIDKALALVRFGNRWGLRTMSKDAQAVHAELRPEVPYHNVQVQAVYEIRPLPHGIQKSGVQALLREWCWQAKPLQPSRSDQYGAGWMIGGSEPPAWVFQTTDGDILVSVHRKNEEEKQKPVVLSSLKTKTHLRQGQKASKDQKPIAGKENTAPFDGKDPWGGYNNYKPAGSQDVSMTVSTRLDQVQTKMQESLRADLKGEHEARFQKLETGLTELKEQNGRFERWFHEAGSVSSGLQQQVNAIAGQVQDQKKEPGNMGDKIDKGFANIEALLSKSRRTSED